MRRRPGSLLAAYVAAAALAAIFLALVWTLTPWQPLPDATIEPAPVERYFTPQQIARSEAFHDAIKWPSWLALAVGIAVPVVIGFSPLGRRLAVAIRGRANRWPAQVAAITTMVLGTQWLATLPLRAWGHAVSTSYGLSTQSWAGWLADAGKSLAVAVVLTALALVLLVGFARRFPATWFAPAGLAAAALVVVLSFAYPVVFEPLFNRFTPMHEKNSALQTRLLALAARDHVEVTEVLVADASRRTTAVNAYVSGFGASKRIVVYDTLLASAAADEVALVVAHELGHAAEDDVLVGTLEGAVGAAFGVTGLFLLLRRPVVRRLAGTDDAGNPAVVPVVLALVTVGSFLALPLQNTVSRHVEARADVHALDLTRDPPTFIAAQQRLSVTNLTHLEPNDVLAFWFTTHPAPLERIGLAEQWQRRYDGPP